MAMSPIDGGSVPLIQPQTAEPLSGLSGPQVGKQPTEVSFGDVLGDMVAAANAQGHRAHDAAVAITEGRSDDIHGTMIEVQKSAIQTRLVGTVKNKVVDAFYELWRMNI